MASLVTEQNSLSAGELSPSLYGRQDLEKYHHGTTTCRNFFVDYRGGISSRAGLAYVGTCKQSGNSPYPPRDIPFQFSQLQGYALEFGDNYMRIKQNGAYITEGSGSFSSVSNSGLFNTGGAPSNLAAGDWIFIQTLNPNGAAFSGLTWIVATTPTSNTFTLTDLFGVAVTSVPNSFGAQYNRIYTLTTPYLAIDLPYLKYTQSADTMTLTCVNTVTGTEYPPYSLKRLGTANWVLTQDTFHALISAPQGVTATAQSSTTLSTWYSYLVTAVNQGTGEESVASPPAAVQNNDISIYAGSNTISWNSVSNATAYNVYAATPSYSQQVPIGALYGYIGTAYGNSFTDSNIVPDYTLVPPTHQNPFARGPILAVNTTAGGSGYTQNTIGYTINTSTGSGFAGTPIVSGGAYVGFYISNSGEGYKLTDTITITDSGAGSGATATLNVGPQTGTYPSTCAYYQQRRVYAGTTNNPDTYFMSQPGLFNNMDSSIPVSDSDAIIGTPWAQQVNGIQFLVTMPGGLVILTGKGAWQLNGGSSASITAANQVATPQAYNGCHDHVQPIVVNYDILYVQSKGSIVRDLSYNFFVNIYTGTDLTVLSNHLFSFHQVNQWTWAEEPFKLVWLIRDDGKLLSLTYLKEQDVYAWSRHDTKGQFVSVCSIVEQTPAGSTTTLPALTDAVYFIVKRFINNKWVYYSERMNNRVWNNVEDAFCIDAGLPYPVSFPNATLYPQAASGNNVPFIASSNVFNLTSVGQVIRVDGGKGTVVSYVNPTKVLVNITDKLTLLTSDDPSNTPAPAIYQNWSMSTPVTSVGGLNHLEGQLVSILADGSVIPQQIVTGGKITLPYAASQIVVGLPYICQAQTTYLDHNEQGQTIQNKRKTIVGVGLRVEQSRGLSIGADQIDAATQPDYADQTWTKMTEIKERSMFVNAGSSVPLYTGDYYQTVTSGWDIKGQVAVQQSYPLPANILSVVTYASVGDDK